MIFSVSIVTYIVQRYICFMILSVKNKPGTARWTIANAFNTVGGIIILQEIKNHNPYLKRFLKMIVCF